ncbi:MAG TPA: L-seryl-tRNA(Sec) selenium transferase [Candidatus Dormibacteraeota bacterium]|jgi:L-seryl-tRNA(Ser) seleniumtransferase|nr:L-seryl-tRNA(Sec) selenium transferase [Candidatus Dormibacteraeota bacterium]
MASPRELPAVDRLATHPLLAEWRGTPALTAAVRAVLDEERAARIAGDGVHGDDGALAAAAAAWLQQRLHPGPRRVINATGIVVHTNLGRAPLSRAAQQAVADVAAGYSDLEFDLAGGTRGSRHDHVRTLLATLCGAEDALVTTNNAAAVLLTLSALCRGGEVLVSRGEAVEIGGGFRIPEVMRLSGARMVDVGTTNRTRAADYADAITPRTRAIVRVHPSNFAVVGFTARPTTAEVSAIARGNGLLLIEDAGSGAFDDPARIDAGLAGEPVLPQCIRDGADVVTASGDKLCGGPQAGLIAGRESLIATLRRHPLMRAVRPDKMALAALGATLAAHLRGDAGDTVPVQWMLRRTAPDLADTAQQWCTALRDGGIPADTREAQSASGGGSLPGLTLPTTCVTLPGPTGRLMAALRGTAPAVVARAESGRVWLDPRTVLPGDVDDLLRCVHSAWRTVHP